MVGTSNPSVLERFPWSHGALDKKRPGTMATQRWSWPWKLVKTSKTSVPWRKNVGRLVVNTWENVGWFLVNGWIFLSWTVHRRGYCFAGRASKIPCSPRIFVRSNDRCRSYLDIFKMATSNESNESNMAPDWKLGRSPPKSSHGDWKPSPGANFGKCHCHQPGGGHPDLDHPNGAVFFWDGSGLLVWNKNFTPWLGQNSYWKRP